MSEPSRETLFVLTRLPQDLRDALAARYALVEGEPGAARIAVTTSMAGADAALMARWPALRLIACQGAGLERIDLRAAARHGIAVSHTPDVLTEDTADFAVALLYGVARRVVAADRFVRDGRWAGERMAPATRLFGKPVGIVGLGRIGEAVARRLAGLGLRVAWTGPRGKPAAPWPFVPSLHALAAQSEVLVLCAPGGAATRGMVDASVLDALGPQGFLINIARGEVVHEAALLDALERRRIAGAGLDVFASEPVPDARFLPLDNVVLAPHYASLTNETRAAMIGRMLDDIGAFLAGTPFTDAARMA